MYKLAVQIERYVDDHQPGWVEVDFFDAEERRHAFVDKVPIFTVQMLGPDSTYPQPGKIRCEVQERYKDTRGRELARITTEKPDDVESTEGRHEFIVLSSQLSLIRA